MPRYQVDEAFALSIGGMHFEIHADQPLVLHDPSDSYGEFVSRTDSLRAPIHVELHTSGCPDVAAMDVIFDAVDAWSLRTGPEGDYFVGHGPSSLAAPPWVLKINDAENAVVYCNPDVVDRDGRIICPVTYPVDQLLCISLLAASEGMLVHCAGLKVGTRIYLFAGKSGAGKSTFSQCVSERDGVSLISDDRMIVRREAGKWFSYGTPWPGDAGYARNEGAELAGIYSLEHSDENSMIELGQREAVERLLAVTSVPWYDADRMGAVMGLVGDLTNDIGCGLLNFRPDGTAGAYVVDRLEADKK